MEKDQNKIPIQNYDNFFFKQNKYELNITNDMPYKINLNNCAQKYLEYRDKGNIYNSTYNFTYLALKEGYNYYNDIDIYNTNRSNSKIEKILKVLSSSRLISIFEDKENLLLEIINFFKNLFIICINIFNCPYCEFLENDIIVNIFNNDLDFDDLENKNKLIILEINECCNFLVSKIKEGKCLFLEEKLKTLQIKIIEIYLLNRKEKINYYQILFFFKDIDFCLKIFLQSLAYDIKDEIFFKIINSFCSFNMDKRFNCFSNYSTSNNTDLIKEYRELNEEDMKILNNSLKIKNTIIIGEKPFHDFIKNLKLSTIEYFLKIEELNDFCNTSRDKRKIDDKYAINKYFIIIEYKIFKEYYKSINLLSCTYGLFFILIIYIDENKKVLINKNILSHLALVPIIICFSKEDLLHYYSDNDKIQCNFFLVYKLHNKNKEKIDIKLEGKFPVIEKNKDEIDNGWEMINQIDENFFKNLYVLNIGFHWILNNTIMNLYELYKEKNISKLYLQYYCNYFGVSLYPETIYNEETLMKFILYAYTLDEGNKDKSFYSILNDTLRTGKYEKIKMFLEIFSKLLELIKFKAIMSYKGKVYRASFFKDDLLKQITVGKKMINAALWSCSKDENVAKNFKKIYNKNVIIHLNLDGNFNVDIHEEKLSKFPHEKEVLILPFCTFEIKNIEKIQDQNIGEYYKIELEIINNINKLEFVKTANYKYEEEF